MRPFKAFQWCAAHAAFLLFLAFLAICARWGGASSADEPAQMVVRIAGIVFLVSATFLPGVNLARVRAPLLFLGALAALMLLQLVPLPPSVWLRLPGRAFFGEAALAAGIPQPWRPLSLTPDLTWNALLALIPAAAALVGMAALPREARFGVLWALLGIALLSALLGILQINGGTMSSFYWYDVTNRGTTTGIFANRNHHAALLAMALPMLAVGYRSVLVKKKWKVSRRWLAGAAVTLGVMLLPFILLAGSRAGVLLAVLGVVLAYFLGQAGQSRHQHPRSSLAMPYFLRLAPAVAAIGVIGASLMLARAPAVQRLMHADVLQDQRAVVFKPLFEMAITYMPAGSGFGSFDSVNRHQETTDQLSLYYLNHAHDDPLELAIEVGAPGLLLLFVFLLWWTRRAILSWYPEDNSSRAVFFARLGSALSFLLMLASLVDYPLRTPLMGAIFAIACAWMCPNVFAEARPSYKTSGVRDPVRE